jgi:hypothetical protein
VKLSGTAWGGCEMTGKKMDWNRVKGGGGSCDVSMYLGTGHGRLSAMLVELL